MSGWNESAWYLFFVGAAVKSTAVLCAAWLVSILLRRRSAAARHLVWTAASAALLALPLLSISLPALRVPVAGTFLTPNIVFETTASASGVTSAGAILARPKPTAALKSRTWRPDWRLWLMLLWAAGAAVALAQMGVACAAIWRVRRSANLFTFPDLSVLLEPMMRALGIRHHVDLLEARRGSMPMTSGLLRPAVFLPADAAQWSADRRRVVLLHELAHVRRGDVATHLLARTALSLYWWNPLAWSAWREFLKERERATDDLVLAAGARASEYASHLLEVARTMQSAPAIGWAAVAMARPSQLEGRLLAILDSGVNRKAPGRASALFAALLAVAIIAPFAAVQAQDSATPPISPEVDATIRAANSQKNHEILETAAAAFARLQQYDTAQKLLESAAAIRAEVSGESSVQYGVGLLKIADLERMRHRSKEAEAFYAKAAQVLGDRPEAARALMYLGTTAVIRKDFPQAFDYFQRAQRVDAAQAGPALMWMAVVRQRENNLEDAETLFKNALSVEDVNSSDAATTMRLYSGLLRQQGRTAEARDLDALAAARQKANADRDRERVTFALNSIDRAGAESASASQISPRVTFPGGVNRVGGSVTAPALLRKVEPAYSEEARAAKIEGRVTVYIEVGPDGRAYNMRVLQGVGLGLDENALEALAQWVFRPGAKDGVPVPVAATVEVNFRLM